jgi:hypothetical protein
MHRFTIAAFFLCACHSGHDEPTAGSGANPAAPVETGTIARWPEATSHLDVVMDSASGSARVNVDPTAAPGAALTAFWSIASTSSNGGSAFFYAVHPPDGVDSGASRIVYAAGATSVQGIHDASSFDYSHDSVGPVPVGGIVLVQNLASRRYLAIVIDAIEPADPRTAGAGPYAFADIRWYLTSEDSPSFAAAPDPVPH